MKKLAVEDSVKQGIKGQISEIAGNQMPSPDEPASQPRPLKTTLYIYEKTNTAQVDRIGTSASTPLCIPKKLPRFNQIPRAPLR